MRTLFAARSTGFAATVSLVMLAASSRPAHAELYTIINLGVLDGWNSSHGWAVNDSGQVTGHLDPGDPAIAFLWSNGTMIELSAPTATESFGQGINSSGHVTGIARTSEGRRVIFYDGNSTGTIDVEGGGNGINDSGQIAGTSNFRAFVHSNGMTTFLGALPGGLSSTANAINNNGQITGGAEYSDFLVQHAYLYDNGVMTDLGTLGGASSEGYAINDSGQIAGESSAEENGVFGQRAFLYDGNQMLNLGVLPGDQNSAAYGINNSGQVVGMSMFDSPELGQIQRAFLYSNGVMTDLNDLIDPNSGWTLNEARDINNNGWIVGTGTFQEQTLAFLLIPTANAVPEPGSLAMLSLAAIGLTLRKMRRRSDASCNRVPQTCNA